MRTIYKCLLGVEDIQYVGMPEGSEILSVQVQHNMPCIWVLCDPKAPVVEERCIITHGTGHPVSGPNLKFIGTYQLDGGSLVFHVFERPDK